MAASSAKHAPSAVANKKVFEYTRRTTTSAQQEKLETEKVNVFTGEKRTSREQAIHGQRSRFPMRKARSRLLEALGSGDVVLVSAGTGTGKTTQATQCIALNENPARMQEQNLAVALVQPRRQAAVSVATRLAEETGTKLGREYGLHIRNDSRQTENVTFVKTQTEGMLLAQSMRDDPDFKRYTVLILDEVHERSANNDLLMGLAKRAMKKRPGLLKVVVMSATIDIEEFKEYLGLPDEQILQVAGQTQPRDDFYLDGLYGWDAPVTVARTALAAIHFREGPGDIIVFLPGNTAINNTSQAIKAMLAVYPDWADTIQIVKLSRKSIAGDEEKLRSPPPFAAAKNKFGRKIYLATNVAETSITIDGLAFVIDTGDLFKAAYNPRTGCKQLQQIPCPKAQSKQRAGRVARNRPGKVFRVYSYAEYCNRPDQMMPGILSCNMLEPTLIILGFEDTPFKFDWMTPPPVESCIAAYQELFWIGLLGESKEFALNPTGIQIGGMSIEPYLGKAMIMSAQARDGVLVELIIITSMITAQEENDLWLSPRDPQEKAELKAAQLDLYDHSGCHLTFLSIFHQFKDKIRRGEPVAQKWCHQNFLDINVLKKADTARESLFFEFFVRHKKYNYSKESLPYSDPDYRAKILSRICSSGFPRSAYSNGGIRPPTYMKFRAPLDSYAAAVNAPVAAAWDAAGVTTKEREFIIFHESFLAPGARQAVYKHVSRVNLNWLLFGAANANPATFYFDVDYFERDSWVQKAIIKTLRQAGVSQSKVLQSTWDKKIML